MSWTFESNNLDHAIHEPKSQDDPAYVVEGLIQFRFISFLSSIDKLIGEYDVHGKLHDGQHGKP